MVPEIVFDERMGQWTSKHGRFYMSLQFATKEQLPI